MLRNLRWAAELAVSDDEGKAPLGLAELQALADSDLLEAGQKLFIDAALEAVVREPEEELEEAGVAAQAVQVGDDGRNDEANSVVPPGADARKDAAKMLVNRSAVTRRYVSSNVRKVANAQSAGAAEANPAHRTTVEKKK